MRLVPLLLGLSLVGCNADMPGGTDGSPSGGGDAGDDGGAGGDLGFMPAAHLPFPEVTAHTAPVLSTPQMVTITYADFTQRAKMEQLGDFLVGSQWIDTVGKEYGVGRPVHLKKVELAANAPATITDANIVAFLKQQAMMGTLPAPSATNNQLVYLMYFPSATKINDGTGAILCQQGYAGYHSSDTLNGVDFTYAVLPFCGDVLDDLTSTVAHELIEAATDPTDGYYMDVPATDHWSGMNTQEVADLCQDLPNVTEGGWALQRSWSNLAAQAGTGSPCVPIPAGEVFNDVTPSPPMVVTLAAGASTTFTMTGWSMAPVADWTLAYAVTEISDFDPMAMITPTPINNGTSTTVTLTVPAGTAAGKLGSVQIYAGQNSGNFWPVTVLSK